MHSIDYFKKEIEKFPTGSKNHTFFTLILKKIEPDFLRDSVRKQVTKNSASLSESTRQYFKYHILFNAALKALEREELQKNETVATPCKTSPRESDVKNIELFYLNLMKKYINPDKLSSDFKFFEMLRTFLPEVLANKQQQQSEFAKLFTKLVESNIREFCIKLSEYSNKEKFRSRDWEVQFDATVKELSQKATYLDSISINFKQHSAALKEMVSLYYKELVDEMDILQRLLNLYSQKLNFQLTSAILFTQESRSLQLKMRFLELEALTATYHENTLEALKKISEELNNKAKAAEKQLKDLNESLQQYKILGPEFEKLAEQYCLLVERIEKQKWMIKSLKAKESKMNSEAFET